MSNHSTGPTPSSSQPPFSQQQKGRSLFNLLAFSIVTVLAAAFIFSGAHLFVVVGAFLAML